MKPGTRSIGRCNLPSLFLKFIQIEPNYASFAYVFMRKQSLFYRIAECGAAWTLRKHGHENAALVVLMGRSGLLHATNSVKSGVPSPTSTSSMSPKRPDSVPLPRLQ